MDTKQSGAQAAGAVLLVRPACFGFNAEAAATNAFSRDSADPEIQAKALAEFEVLAESVSGSGVDVLILDDSADPPKPDAVFPNNWFSTHSDGTLVLYPMATAARRPERRIDAVRALLEAKGFLVRCTVDLSGNEKQGRYLEGTGSLVLDRPRRRAYANRSPRTDPAVTAQFDRGLGYSTMLFDARDPAGRPIYHTNVLLSLGTQFAALCPATVAPEHRDALAEDIEASGRTIVEFDFGQLKSFGCNLIELRSAGGEPIIALSSTARAALRPAQLRALESFGEVLDIPIPTIEAVGGGGVRCMIAEIHLPKHEPA